MLDESVVLFGGCLSQGLEPVCVVAGSVVDSPLFQSCGHAVGILARQRLFILHCVDEGFERFARKIFEHLLAVEYLLAVVFVRPLFGNLYRHCRVVECLFYNFKS